MEYFPIVPSIFLSVVGLVCLGHFNLVMSQVPRSVPWAGLRDEAWSETKACIREWTAGLRTFMLGYEKFNKKGLPCLVPDPGFHPIVMVPQEHLAWMSNKPDDVLSARKTQVGRFALTYLTPGLDINHDAFMMGAIRKELTRSLGSMQADMIEDIRYTIDNAMGLDDISWKEVCITRAMESVVMRTMSRVLVGLPLCHSEVYLHSSISFAKWLGAAVVVVGQYLPWMIKPFFGYLAALPIYYYRQKTVRFMTPVVRERLANLKRKRANPSFEFEEPKDLITWMAQALLDDPETKDKGPEFLASRLLLLTLGAIHTTIMTATNIMLDLTSSDPSAGFWEQLRQEAAGVFQTADDWNNPASLQKLPFADSTIRETLRESPVLSRIMLREVMPRDGITLPSGHHLSKGAWVAAGTVGVHHDDRFYPNPYEYNPFRFVPQREQDVTKVEHETLTDKASVYRKNQALATTSEIYLAFGYGKHACPGRWLVAHLLKLMLAYVTLNYDIQYIAQRPTNRIFGDSIVPSRTATMRVRRKMHI